MAEPGSIPGDLTFCFAQITDLHVTTRDDEPKLAAREQWLAAAVADANTIPDLDAVLVTGDLVDYGLPAEIDRVIGHLRKLRVPWYAIPGNHDIAWPGSQLDRRSFYEQVAAATPDGATVYAGTPARGSWTVVP